jgi:ribose-phosphate pyrophosphokinase
VIEMAKELKILGANKIYASISHMLLRETGVEKLEDSPIELMISTDSVDNPFVANCKKVKIFSVAPLIGEAVKRIHNREPVSPLFQTVPLQMMIDELSPMGIDEESQGIK